jgi:hypothetical protein
MRRRVFCLAIDAGSARHREDSRGELRPKRPNAAKEESRSESHSNGDG